MIDAFPKVAIVIPVFNRRETTLRCLRSLARIESNELSVKIFVVDDASTDGTADAIEREFHDVTLINGTGTLHYAGGTNRGIQEALKWNPDFVVAMNDDAVLDSKFLIRLVETAENNFQSIVGPLLLLWDTPHRVFQVNQRWETLRGGWIIPTNLTAFSVPEKPFEVECIVGNCVLIPSKAIHENGLMDEKNFPCGWGDAQYMTRLRKAGWRLFVDPRSRVWCEPNTNPSPLHTLSVTAIIRTLFIDQRHPLNLRRQFDARWYSAPTRLKAVAAFLVYFVSLTGKFFKFGAARVFRS